MPEISLTRVAGYCPSPKGETTHHLFARSRTLRIKLTCGFNISIVLSISPLHAVLDYCLALTDFHGVSRAESPSQLTWMSVIPNADNPDRYVEAECRGCAVSVDTAVLTISFLVRIYEPIPNASFSPNSSSVRFSGLSFFRFSSFHRTAGKSLTARGASSGFPAHRAT